MAGTHYVTHRSEACRECIATAIGDALVAIGDPVETPRGPDGRPIGCCGREAQRYAFTYRLEHNDDGSLA